MATRKHIEKKRRTPQRGGSRNTVDAIFEATARIIDAEGLAGLNTNRIAEKAGVSIGTLYGYFPDKQAIIIAMARRQLEADREIMMTAILPVIDDPLSQIERVAVRAAIATYKRHTKVRKIIMQTMIGYGLGAEVSGPTRAVAEVLSRRLSSMAGPGSEALVAVQLFIITCAVEAAVRAAAYERSDLLDSPTFEDQLVRLAMVFVPTTSASLPHRI